MSEFESHPEINHAREIFGPSATAIGLLLASVAFLYTTKLNQSTLQELTDLILYVIVYFGLSTTFFAFYIVFRIHSLMKLALFLFPFSWILLTFTAINLLSSLAYNKNLLQLVGVEYISLSHFMIILMILFLIVVLIAVYLGIDSRLQRDINSNVDNSTDFTDGLSVIGTTSKKGTLDLSMEFIKSYVEIEKLLSDLYNANKKEIQSKFHSKVANYSTERGPNAIVMADMLKKIKKIDGKTYASIDDLRPIRNSIIHGRDVSTYSLKQAFRLSLIVRNMLKNFAEK